MDKDLLIFVVLFQKTQEQEITLMKIYGQQTAQASVCQTIC